MSLEQERSRKASSQNVKKKEKILKEYRKFKNRLFLAVISGIASFFLVPVFINFIEWEITLTFFENTLELDSLVLYVIITLIIYVFMRVIYYYLMRRVHTKF